MKLFVKVKLKAKTERVKETSPCHFDVAVKEPPIEGRANDAVIRQLAKHLSVPKSRLRIVRGQGSRNKVLEVL